MRPRRTAPPLAHLTLLCAGALTADVCAQDGASDPGFHTLDDGAFGEGASMGNGAPGVVHALARQSDGRIWAAGLFQRFHGSARPGIVRLQADGSLDPTFAPGSGIAQGGAAGFGYVRAIALQPDGRALIGGSFVAYDGAPRPGLARLLDSGALDPSFTPNGTSNVHAIALQSDGKVVIGGSFTVVSGAPRSCIARLNPDGSLDPTFEPGEGATGVIDAIAVNAVALQPDGRVVIAGEFNFIDGAPRERLARLNADGSRDGSFQPGAGLSWTAYALHVQPDGNILVGGAFQSAGGLTRRGIARFLPSGALDSSFFNGLHWLATVHALRLQPDGRVLAAGSFGQANGFPSLRVTRLLTDGALDTSFNAGLGLDADANDLVLEPSGAVLVAGAFVRSGGSPRRGVTRLESNGSTSASFCPGRGPDKRAAVLTQRDDGKLYIGGEFTTYDNTPANRVARLNADGSHDVSFAAPAALKGAIHGIWPQTDGRVLIAGPALGLGVGANHVARLALDGSHDATYSVPNVNGTVRSGALLADGRLLICGTFTTIGGVPRPRLARLDSSGSLDLAFDVGVGANDVVERVIVQPDGKLLLLGAFSSFGGVPRAGLARVTPSGALDTAFVPPNAIGGEVFTLAAESDGAVLIGGAFTSVGGVPRTNIARLRSDGSLDMASFDGPGPNGAVRGLLPQLDGSLLVRGDFSSYAGTPRARIARVAPNGSLDSAFDPGAGPNDPIDAWRQSPGGDLLVVGDFTNYGGAVRHRIARVKLDWIDWVNYCTSGVSSQGCVANITASGAASVSAASGFTLAVQHVDGARPGLIFYGLGGRRSTPLGDGTAGFYCVRSPVQRMGMQSSGGTDGTCDGVQQRDWLAYLNASPSALGAPFAAGVNVQAQAWRRDPASPDTIALSDALEFITVP